MTIRELFRNIDRFLMDTVPDMIGDLFYNIGNINIGDLFYIIGVVIVVILLTVVALVIIFAVGFVVIVIVGAVCELLHIDISKLNKCEYADEYVEDKEKERKREIKLALIVFGIMIALPGLLCFLYWIGPINM